MRPCRGTGLNAIRSIETPPVHHAARRRCGNMAVRRTRPAGWERYQSWPPVAGRRAPSVTPDGVVSAGIARVGFVDGQNIAIELRYAQKGPQQLPELAAELISLKVDVILA